MSRRMLGWVIVALALAAGSGEAEGKKAKEVMRAVDVTVDYRAEWDMDTGSGRGQGELKIKFEGRMGLNEGFSSTAYGLPAMLLPYAIEAMHASYEYKETVKQQDPPEGCPDLVEKYEATGSVDLPLVPGPGSLLVYYPGSIMKGKGVWKHVPADQKELMVDRYEMVLPGKSIKAPGRKRPANECKFKDAERKVELGPVSVAFLMDSGKMTGKRSWRASAKGVTPAFQVAVSDLPAKFNKKPYEPVKKDDGEVGYSLSWTIDEAAAVDIERKVEGEWRVLTDDLREVVAGERIELRGVVMPKKKDPKKGRWTVGEGGDGAVKEFKASQKQGGPVRLGEGDLGGQIVTFHWYRDGPGKVSYRVTVDDRQLEKEVEFRVKEPSYDVSWEIGAGTRMVGEMRNEDLPLFRKWPGANWPPTKPGYGKEGLGGKLAGLQFDGILFTARNADESEMPGKTQWVQLIGESQVYCEGIDCSKPCSNQGLDHLYPCAVNESFFDAPAMPTKNLDAKTTQWKVEMAFELYVMFKPKAAKSQWVTVKRIDWRWTGMIYRDAVTDGWKMDPTVTSWPGKGSDRPDAGDDPSVQATYPSAVDEDEYPEWSKNSASFKCTGG
jgi:hypothetical protein